MSQTFLKPLIIVLAIFYSISCKSKKTIVITENNQSDYVILLPESASTHDKNAASILQKYIEKISNVEIPILKPNQLTTQPFISIGLTSKTKNQDKIKHDGFVIESINDNIYIYGIRGKGTLYGVYTFLEEYLACQKLTGDAPITYTENPTITITGPILNVQNPEFIFRQSYYPASQDPEYLDWHKLHRFEDLWGLWGHSFFKIINPDEYFNDHPEYFALSGGIRQKTQLCLSHPKVHELTVNYFKNEIINNPDAIYWSISPMDNSGYCQCEDCKKIDESEGGPQGSMIQFVNKIAAHFPNQNFTTLAYTYTSKPPKITKPRSNVYIFISSIDAFRTEPLAKEMTAKDFRNNLKAWSTLTENIFIWDYTTQFTNFLVPFPDYNHIESNINFFKDNRVKGVFFHGSEYYFSDQADLSSYLQAKYLWGSKNPIEYLKKHFVEQYYGPAAEDILTYINNLEKSIQDSKSTLDIYGNPIMERNGYLSPEQIEIYVRLLESAHEKVETKPIFKNRIEALQLAIEFVVLEQSKAYGIAKHGYFIYNEDLETFEINPRWEQRINRFIKKAKEFNIYQIAEVYHNLDNYAVTWTEILKKGWKNNVAKNALLSLRFPYVTEYPANEINTLVDGIDGSLDYSYNWLLFNGQDLDLLINFEKEKEIREVSIGFLHDPKHYIFLPTEIKILSSEDGENFTEIARKIVDHPLEENMEVYRKDITISINHFAPFYRVVAVPLKQLPVWRYHDHRKPSIACDEVFMR